MTEKTQRIWVCDTRPSLAPLSDGECAPRPTKGALHEPVLPWTGCRQVAAQGLEENSDPPAVTEPGFPPTCWFATRIWWSPRTADDGARRWWPTCCCLLSPSWLSSPRNSDAISSAALETLQPDGSCRSGCGQRRGRTFWHCGLPSLGWVALLNEACRIGVACVSQLSRATERVVRVYWNSQSHPKLGIVLLRHALGPLWPHRFQHQLCFH